MSMTAYIYSSVHSLARSLARESAAAAAAAAVKQTHARRAKGNPVPIPEPGSGTAYNSGPRKSVRRGNPK